MSSVDTKGPRLMTQAEYARHRDALGLTGGTRQAVARAVEAGRISTIGDDKLIDPAVADIQWERNSRARASTRPVVATSAPAGTPGSTGTADAPLAPVSAPVAAIPPAPATTGYQDARTRREQAEAEKAEIELAKMAGRLIDRAPAVQAVYDAFHALRDAILAAPRRVAPQCIGINDSRELEHLITGELRKSFDAFEERMLATLDEKAAA